MQFLEECMDCCGTRFTQEVGKFKFLNELIKLVSRKHLGDKTPKEIQDRILDILFTWTSKYQSEPKIKEAYDMLKKQGVVHQPTKNVLPNNNSAQNARSLDKKTNMDVRELALKKLIYSKNPKDVEQANLLIQNIVREDERRAQIKVRRSMELKKVTENVTVLNEMLENYNSNTASPDDLSLINELHEACQVFRPMVLKLATENQQGGEELANSLEINDSLVNVLDRYNQIVRGGQKSVNITRPAASNSSNLDDILGLDLPTMEATASSSITKNNVMKELGDIFSKPLESMVSVATSQSPMSETKTILQPEKISSSTMNAIKKVPESKYQGLFNTESKPLSLNQEVTTPKSMQLDLDSLVLGMKSKLMPQTSQENEHITNVVKTEEIKDDILLDSKSNKSNDDDDAILSDDVPGIPIPASPGIVNPSSQNLVAPKDVKSLAEITIDLDTIMPSNESPRTVMDEPEGLKIMLNFAKDRPRSDVAVIVISTINQGKQGITDFQFDASVKKPCKLRLLPASGSVLQGVKPFRPPADGIMQVLLLSNPTENPVNMICILSYCIDDDPDPVKESIEVKDIPCLFE